jgi:hypothetical protein
MGVVIRPPTFRNGRGPIHLALAQRRPLDKRRLRVLFARFFNLRVVAIAIAMMALAWMLALAGTAFAVRTVLVLCFAALAGRPRRVGVPARIVRRSDGRSRPNY